MAVILTAQLQFFIMNQVYHRGIVLNMDEREGCIMSLTRLCELLSTFPHIRCRQVIRIP